MTLAPSNIVDRCVMMHLDKRTERRTFPQWSDLAGETLGDARAYLKSKGYKIHQDPLSDVTCETWRRNAGSLWVYVSLSV